MLDFLQFEKTNSNVYKKLFVLEPNLVRTESEISERILKDLNIFQLVSLFILFKNYIYHKKGDQPLKIYLQSLKNSENQNDKNIRLLYLVLLFELNSRIPFSEWKSNNTYRNLILRHYPPDLLSSFIGIANFEFQQLSEQVNAIADEMGRGFGGGKKKTTGKKVRK